MIKSLLFKFAHKILKSEFDHYEYEVKLVSDKKINKIIEGKDKKYKSLENDFNYKVKSIQKFKENINVLESNLSLLSDEVKKIKSEYVEKEITLNDVITKLMSEKTSIEDFNKELMLNIEILNSAIIELNNKNNKLQNKVEKLNKDNLILKSNLRNTSDKLTTYIVSAKSKNKKINELEEINKDIWEDLNYFSSKVEELIKEQQN